MSLGKLLRVLGFLILLLDGHAERSLSNAQSTGRPSLVKIKSLKCVFPLYATGTWNNGELQAQVKAESRILEFDLIDPEEGTARLVGTIGPPHLTVRLSTKSLHLLEIRTIPRSRCPASLLGQSNTTASVKWDSDRAHDRKLNEK